MEHTAQHKLIISALPQLAQRNWERQSRQGDELEISKAPYGDHRISLSSFTELTIFVSTWYRNVSKQHFPPLLTPCHLVRRIPTAWHAAISVSSKREALPASFARRAH